MRRMHEIQRSACHAPFAPALVVDLFARQCSARRKARKVFPAFLSDAPALSTVTCAVVQHALKSRALSPRSHAPVSRVLAAGRLAKHRQLRLEHDARRRVRDRTWLVARWSL